MPRAALAAAALLLVLATIPGAKAQTSIVTIGTAGVTGVYYPAGGAICRLVNKGRKLHGLRCGVESTEGSVQNLRALRQGDLDFGIVQSDTQADAVRGAGVFDGEAPFTDLRSVFSLHPEPMQVLVAPGSGIESVADLVGKRVNIGSAGSGTRVLAERLLAAAGVDTSDFSLVAELKSIDQAQALCNGKIDAAIWAAGTPNGSTDEATRACNAKILPLEGDWVDRLVEAEPSYSRATIPGDVYVANRRDIPSYGPRATLVTTAGVPDEAVYTLVKAVFDDLDEFKSLHPALARLEAAEMISEGLTAPLHPGALRYYRERGWM